MAEKDTLMRLKVDLQCAKCTEKVKKVLSKFPEVRSQVFDDKNNIVTITVVCCSPKKIRDEICCKGGVAIKSIQIVETPKKPDAGDKKKVADKTKDRGEGDKKKVADKHKGRGEGEKKNADKPNGRGEGDKMKVADKRKDKDKPTDKPKNKPADKPAKSKQKDPGPILLQLPAGMMVMPKIKIEVEIIKAKLSFGF
ncbi:hypothetical protein QN277_005505 [Acacia crassicarpa]|uniref:HMA domain-containing protein n=1 Tax=Acacia crassicarpa TaxID=499986 RepID=A0AAE1IZS5_9FABA|nr:hypothetical protein QN277_005505 [Acacia crassicarpa]